MNYTEDEMNEKPVFIIEEKPDVIEGQGEGEAPVITIETDNGQTRPKRRMPWIIGTAIATILVCAAAAWGYWYYHKYINIGVEVSATSEENIDKLQKTAIDETPEVVMTSDSILGVALNFYELKGLKGEISFIEPDTTNTDVYLYCRCVDQTTYDPKTNHYLGSIVANGKEIESDNSRLGYCAMANDNIVLGIARDEKVKEYVQDQGGSFFRQFILVSKGELPPRFRLHGKVERRALGRWMDGNGHDHIYFIETRHKETMWDFADALREYGFIDAIYITGGTDYSFYRSSDGTPHSIGDYDLNPHNHNREGLVPWVVFKRRNLN